MRTLKDAWTWYEFNEKILLLMSRLGELYWDELPWDGKLGRDDRFRLLDGEQIVSGSALVLAELDDLPVFVFFSVFESIVRREVAESLEAEVSNLQHPALRRSAERLLQNVEEGSFYNNILTLYKKDGTQPSNQNINSLIEEVNRIRRYRNWVAHGRREDERPSPILPRKSLEVLRRFLEVIAQT